jgi:hypothetical protein
MTKTVHRIVPRGGVLLGLCFVLPIPDTLAGPAPAATPGPAPRPPAHTSPAGPAADPGDPAPLPWAQSNRTVGALGGHGGHLRGAAPAARPASTPAPGSTGRDRP